MSIEMTISFRVVRKNREPVPPAQLDKQLDQILDSLVANAGEDVTDVDVDAILAASEVTFSMVVATDDETRALVRAVELILPAVSEAGGFVDLGQLQQADKPRKRRTQDVWRPKEAIPA